MANPFKDDLPEGLEPMSDERYDALMVGLAEQQAGRYDDARRIFEGILQSAVGDGDRFGVIGATHMLGNVAFNQCRDAESVRLHTEVLQECTELGFAWGIGTSLGNLAFVDLVEGRFDDAASKFDGAIAAYEAAGLTDRADSVRGMVELYVRQRQPLTIPRVS
jgi:hypothetical protein